MEATVETKRDQLTRGLDFSKNLLRLTITYLFMNTDGYCAREEMERFNLICDAFDVSKAEKDAVISYVTDLRLTDKDNSDAVISEIEYFVTEYNKQENMDNKLFTENEKAQIIWTLINLGYADYEYAPSEDKVIKQLASFWNVDENLVESFFDTAESILALVKKKDWIATTDKSEAEKAKLCKKIDTDIQEMYVKVEVEIAEANI